MRGSTLSSRRRLMVSVAILWQFLSLWSVLQVVQLIEGKHQVRTIAEEISSSPRLPKEKGERLFIETSFPAVPALASRKPDSIATVSSPVGRKPSRGLNHQTYSGAVVGGQRSIQDWETEDFVLLATVDGNLHARDRSSGKSRWELYSETPVVETIYHRHNGTRQGQDRIDDDDFVWIVEPTEEGTLFRYHPDFGLEKTDMTMKRLVEISPWAPAGTGKMYSGEKHTVTYAIDGRTGSILRFFKSGGGGRMLVDTSRCKPKETDDLEDECESQDSDKIILVGRTEYTVTIEDVDTAELLWTLKYTEWGPNNSDMDLAAQYTETMDNRYVLATFNGGILGFDRSGGNMVPRYKWKLDSPVARVFDVIKSAAGDKSTYIILPQPLVQLDDDNVDQTFVGSTEKGGLYALSEMSYPLVSGGAAQAACYRHKPELYSLPEVERQKILVGLHTSHIGESTRAALGGFEPRGLPAPTEQDVLDQPMSSESTVSAMPSSPSTAMSKLGMTGKWNIALAVPFLLGLLYYFLEGPKLPVIVKGKWTLEVIGKDTSLVVPDVLHHELANLSGPPKEQPSVDAAVETTKQPATAVDAGQPTEALEGSKPTVPGASESQNNDHPREPNQTNEELKNAEEQQVREEIKVVKGPEAVADGPVTPTTKPVDLPQNPDALEMAKAVRFREERPKTPTNEPVEETEVPPIPVAPVPKKKKAHRGQRGGKKKKAMKTQQQEDNDEIGRIVDIAKDIQPTARTLEPDVKIINESGDIDSSIIRIDNLEVHQNAQSTLGLGSQGTVVFKGKFEGRAVAVKRMLRTFFDVAHREVKLLQDSDDHPNVIRYHCMKELDQFLYIALEQCRASLCDVVIEPKHQDLRQLLDPQQVLRQIALGVNHLHQMKIVHRDLKPQNILVSEPKRFPRDPTKVQHPRILISDFGLCKQLEANQSSFRATTAHAAGTSGWRAPELLVDDGSMDMRPFASAASETSGGSSTETMLMEGMSNRRATRSIDVFSMGCVFFFVLTQGGHPFGAMKYSREMNVITGKSDLLPLDALGETGYLARDLIRRMIQKNPKSRPDTQTILMHPYFWSAERRLLFLIDVSDRFEKEKDLEKDGNYKSPFIPMLERDGKTVVKGDWLKRLCRAFYDEVLGNKRRGYDGEKVLDLLRVIRNKRNHYQDMTKAAQAAVGALPDGYLNYFTTRFPDLFMHVYKVTIETQFALRHLRGYFTPVDS